MLTIIQGESFPIYIALMQDDSPLTPDMIENLKICLGSLKKKLSDGGVTFDETTQRWCVFPTQEETLEMPVGPNNVCCHIKYPDGSVISKNLDGILVKAGCCKEVF